MPSLSLVGPYPPPFGGVALHLLRLHEALITRGIEVTGSSTGGIPNTLPIRSAGLRDFIARHPVHLHTDEGNARITTLMGRWWHAIGRPYALTAHSFRERKDLQHLDKRLTMVYRNAHLVIAISEEVKRELVSRLHLQPENVHVITSALPISSWELQHPVPDVIPQQWLDAPIRILANAGRVVAYRGQDLYGIDTLLTAFANVDAPTAALMIVLGEVVDTSIHHNIQTLAARDKRVCIISRMQSPLSTITHKAHVVVRPTRTEGGESLTLSEALELGVWAIGSDAVQRPPGALLFETGNVVSLTDQLREVLQRSDRPTPRISNTTTIDSMIQAYQQSGILR